MCLLIKKGTEKDIMLLRGSGSYCTQNRGYLSGFNMLCSGECNNCKSFVFYEHKCVREEEFLKDYNQASKKGISVEGVYA